LGIMVVVMSKPFFVLLFFALAVYGQGQKRLAILPTVDDGEQQVEPTDLRYLTVTLREIAGNVLQNRYGIMSEQSIIDKLGKDNAAKACKEAEGCLAQLGRKISADYIGQARLGRFGENLTISVELYNSGSGIQVGTIRGDARNVSDLLAVLNEKAPDLFRKMPGVSSNSKAKAIQQPSNDFLDRGILFAVRGDYEMAIEDFTEALKLQPNNGKIYTLRGRAYVAKASEKVTSVADDFSEITAFPYALTPKLVKVYEQAINDFTKAIKLEPKNAVNYRERGRVYSYKKDYGKSITDYNQAIRLYPNDAKAYFGRGVIHNYKGDSNKAIEDFNQAIQMDPNNALAYAERGYAYYNNGYDGEAIEDYSQAIRLEPNYALAYASRALIYYKNGYFDNAIEDYSQLIRLNPNKEFYSLRGDVYSSKGDYDEAIVDYNQAIRLNPNNAEVYWHRGRAYFDKGDYDRAIVDFDQAIKLNRNDAYAYYQRGIIYSKKGNDEKAIDDYNQAIRLNSNDVDMYMMRGSTYLKIGNYDKAFADYNQALKLNPNNADAYYTRGVAYYLRGDYDKAIADFNQAARLDPNDDGTRQALERAWQAKRARR